MADLWKKLKCLLGLHDWQAGEVYGESIFTCKNCGSTKIGECHRERRL